MHWCQQELSQLGVTTPPTARDFLSRRRGTCPEWYISFLHRARAHVAAGSQPILQLAPRLDEETTGELKATQTRLKALQQVGYERFEQAS
jgi:hypothetical protein